MWEESIKCPKCGEELKTDSIREHTDGKKRVYWECKACNLSVMHRNRD